MNVSIISFKISNKQLYHFFYMWWLKKVKNSTVYFIRKFCTSITDHDCIFITTFWAQVTGILINDNLQCMMQVVFLHELRKIRLGKKHTCCSFPRLKNVWLFNFLCDYNKMPDIIKFISCSKSVFRNMTQRKTLPKSSPSEKRDSL